MELKKTVMPLIKWSGSKRKQAKNIVYLFPKHIKTYYEPFLGGGSIMHELIHRILDNEISVEKLVCSDLNKDLISLWNAFKYNRDELFEYYIKCNNTLIEYADINNTPDEREQIKKCQKYYYEERDRFNNMDDTDKEKPYLFFWLTRHSFNGLIRYNKNMQFNASYHVAGKFGILPEQLKNVFDEWGKCIDSVNIEFINCSYESIIEKAKEGDFIYMDPPYAETTGLYFIGKFKNNEFIENLYRFNKNKVDWMLSYDGITGDKNTTQDIPSDLYKYHTYISSGQSNFRKLKKIDVTEVKESLYININDSKNLFL